MVLNSFKALMSAAVLSLMLGATANAAAVRIDVKTQYGISLDGIAKAVIDAKRHFATNADDVVILEFPAGTFDFSQQHGPNARAAIDVSNVQPGPQGRLLFQGQGPSNTTFVFNNDVMEIFGRNVYRVSFIGLHLTVKQNTVSQGHVVSVAPGAVVLEIQDGFPSPLDIYDPQFQATHFGTGRAIRRYTDSKTDPQLDQSPGNVQLPWTSAQQISGRRWQLALARSGQIAPYSPGDLICIKSKKGGQAYAFNGGSDVTFKDVKWTLVTRGIFRGGFDKVQILDSSIERGPPINGQTPCLASAAGGPQIGFPTDPPTTNDLVSHFTAEASGDNSVAFFNATGTLRDSRIADSFTPGILLYKSPSIQLENDQVIRTTVMKTDSLKFYP